MLAPSIAVASPHIAIQLPPGRLGDAIVALGEQTGSSIGVADPSLAALPTKAVHGRMSVDKALAALVRGLPASVIRFDATTFRIIRAARRTLAPKQAPAKAAAQAGQLAEIVVTGSKRGAQLATYPGTVSVLFDDRLTSVKGRLGDDGIVNLLPSVASTALGAGRNKLFVRGIADSSFTGPTQATVGEYLGEARLNYNAPDPDLKLYDIASIEVLEGPQGTLYGAGSLGGIIRIVPAPPVLDRFAANAEAGVSTTAHGAAGSDVSAMVNLPLVTDRIGVRAVAYRELDGGYIDDAERHLDNVNRSRTIGGRVDLHAELGGRWSVDVGGTLQNIDADDSQYAERGLPALTRDSALAQPFDNDYALGSVVLAGGWGTIELLSATAIVRHDVVADYDFTPAGETPTLIHQHNAILLASNETRLSQHRADGTGWVIGTSIVADAERLTRSLGPPADLVRTTGVRNSVIEAAIFANGTIDLLPRLQLSVGGRVSLSHLTGDALDAKTADADEDDDIDRSEHHFVPSGALSWRVEPGLVLFARYERGFRAGGLSTAGEDDAHNVERFRGDTIGTAEAGVRFGSDAKIWSGSASLSYANWENIQADLIDSAGLPITANVGDGRVLGAEAQVQVRPVGGLALDASIFVNDSKLLDPATGFASSQGDDLPNISHVGGRIGARYEANLTGKTSVRLDGYARYVGRSRLGVGDTLDIKQGRYVETFASIRIGRGGYGLTVSADNLLDQVGNRFAFGDPFDVADGRQVTPLRPRTIRVGLDARF